MRPFLKKKCVLQSFTNIFLIFMFSFSWLHQQSYCRGIGICHSLSSIKCILSDTVKQIVCTRQYVRFLIEEQMRQRAAVETWASIVRCCP